MALALSAEQKELLKIFKIEEQYIIPSYQRPYSWEYDQCFQLYNDLLTAYEAKQDYFIGNIIIAKADNNKETVEVVEARGDDRAEEEREQEDAEESAGEAAEFAKQEEALDEQEVEDE